MTTLTAELGRRVRVPEAADAVRPHLVDLLGWEPYTSSPDLVHDDAHPQVPVLGLPGAAPS
ncbi:MAG: hypothetical protein PGN15_12500 [Aeromicrobium erythreum]